MKQKPGVKSLNLSVRSLKSEKSGIEDGKEVEIDKYVVPSLIINNA